MVIRSFGPSKFDHYNKGSHYQETFFTFFQRNISAVLRGLFYKLNFREANVIKYAQSYCFETQSSD